MDDYDDKYQFSIEATDPQGKPIRSESSISVIEFYDCKGYQHRYKIRDFLEAQIQRFEQFFDKKKK